MHSGDNRGEEKKTVQFPGSPRRWLRLGKWFVFLIVALILLSVAADWWAEYVWTDTLGYSNVFLTIFTTKVVIGLVGFILFFMSTFVLLFNIRRTFLREFADQDFIPVVKHRKLFLLVNLAVSLVTGFIGYEVVKGIGWERTLGYINQASFGFTDPYFGQDLSFFVYTLPMWNFVLGVFLVIFGAQLAVKLTFYSTRRLITYSRRAQLHVLSSILLFGGLVAVRFLLAPYERALTNSVNLFQESVVVGVSFTDKFVNIPFDYVMAGVTVLTTLLLALAMFHQRFLYLKIAVPLFVGTIILGTAASLVVQSFIVSPNELVREEPFLENNIASTREAYELDKVHVEDMEINPSLSREMLERNADTIENIRINDTRPLNEVYNQLQTFRPYYNFRDVDIDRYQIDGQYQQVFISVRELTQQNLPDQAQTWINRNLRYTHGYGAAISNVNDITPEGQPEYIVKDLPPEGVIDITRPQIYFGENDYHSVIVNSKVDEFDYPESETSATHRYEADTGIPLAGLNRLLFAWQEKSYRYLISDQITSESQLLQTRNIFDRVKRITPFLDFDSDAYPVVREDGTLVWMLDAFTLTDRYPYSDASGNPYNYIRNSIKVTVDAYTGEVVYYLVDPDDPLAKTYKKMFPDLFTTEIPSDIQDHFRYPVQLFQTQSNLYRMYHMTNLEQFYNREDYWQFPTEKYYGDDISMEPYYVTMKMDDSDKEEFILMIPFTPNTKQNMTAWMGVRNDGDHYGEMFVYEFTRQSNIYGPQQIENRINQNATISQELNLWSQGGSQVIRGNLLVIPIEDTLLYVEPMYIESNNETALPEVKRIIVAYDDYIVMEPTLDQAFERLFTMIEEDIPPESANEGADGEDTQVPSPEFVTSDDLLQDILTTFDDYRRANEEGKYAEAGQALQRIEQLLEQWRERQSGDTADANESQQASDEPGVESEDGMEETSRD